MSIATSLHSGASGIKSHSDAMRVISDNIANVSTIGFKSGRANFVDVLGSNIAGERAGSGSMIGNTQQNFNQGALVGTGNTTDLALRGDGFFVVHGSFDGVSGDYFTRDGTFMIDSDGYMVNTAGLRVQGYATQSDGVLGNTVEDLQLETNAIPPVATDKIELIANLNANTPISGTAFDAANPGPTSDFSTSIAIFDSLGRPHQVEMFFKRVAPTGAEAVRWESHILVNQSELVGGGTGFNEVANVSLTFDTNGKMINYNPTSVSVPWDGADASTMALSFGEMNGGIDGVTSYALDSTAKYISQNGYTSGDLAGLKIDDHGIVRGLFSNGQERVLGQLTVAKFGNNHGLERRGSGLYSDTIDSGAAVVGKPSTGGRGAIVAGSLEGSNVDLAEEFVEMITVQRGFQANSKTINTSDELLNTVLQLKR